jgi:hypothetical protein
VLVLEGVRLVEAARLSTLRGRSGADSLVLAGRDLRLDDLRLYSLHLR